MRTTSDDTAARQRPPLTKRLGPRHWAALDYVAGGITAVILYATVRHSIGQAVRAQPPGGPVHLPMSLTGLLAVFVIAAASIAVALRRRRPVFMLGVLLACSLVATALSGPDTSWLAFFLPVVYVLYLIAAGYDRRRDAVRVLAAVYATLVADTAVLALSWRGFSDRASLLLVSLCVIVVWAIGFNVRQRRRYAVSLQQEAASKAVAQERLRIARELHDVVAHSMSVIAVQAGYGQYVIDTQPGDARAALGAIQATSREALDEMRRMLGALRHADEGDAREAGSGARARLGGSRPDGANAPLFPAPGLAGLDRLVARTAGAGVRVDVTRAGQPRDLPASIDMSAYRIVQEALTNVVRHARAGSCRVLIGYGEDEVTVEVTDDGAGLPVPELSGAGAALNGTAVRHGHGTGAPDGKAPDAGDAGTALSLARAGGILGGGHGIIGMRERVSLLGGEFSAGPLPGYGFRVSARIPLPAGSG